MSSCQANFAASCKCSDIRAIEEEALKALLPEEYSYALCDFEKESDREFICRFRINVDTKEDIKHWLEEFTISSNTTYKISKTFPDNTINNVYKVRMHCHHNTQPGSHNVKNPRAKHTNCPAHLTLTVKQKNFSRKYKSTDFHLPEMATIVVLKHRHNHRIEAADASSESSNAQSNIVHSNEKDDVEVESFMTENGDSSEHINNAHEKDNVEESIIIKKFESAFREISKKAAGNPDILNSIKKFVKSYENIRTEASLVSSLSTFGKFTGFLERKRLTSSKKIGVQSTALARRKTAGGGRLCVQTGRPPKRSYAEEHSYHIKKAKSTILPVKRMKAPHSLGHCFEENINLGKTH